MMIKHFSHMHLLIHSEEKNDDGNEVFCFGCSKMITGSAYSCRICYFFLHKRCAELPFEIIHPMHLHPLSLLPRAPYNSNESRCVVCQNNITSGFTYHCALCHFSIHIGCALRAPSDDVHKSKKDSLRPQIRHEHPLILSEEQNDDSEEIGCNRCRQNISGSAYSCGTCNNFVLHKLCATIPLDMKHPMHPVDHQLTLQVLSYGAVCEVCKQNVYGCAYHCSDCNCNFVVDIGCAVRSQSVKHTRHGHSLNPMLSLALFDCHACGTKHEGLSYVCSTCKFWIHEDCFLLPPAVKHSGHHHFLNLLDSFCYESSETGDESSETGCTCRICGDDMNKNCWIYRCGPCKYFVHVDCSAKTKEGKIELRRADLDEGKLIRLPLANELADLIGQFVKQISEVDPSIQKIPSTFFESEVSTLNEQENAKVCSACVLPISTSFYSCTSRNNFFIHKWCAYLPKQLIHECHQHVLSLKTPEDGRFFHCQCCKSSCSGFSFECFECRDCPYYLDVKCASLPNYIMHETHKHPLLLRNNSSTKACAACAEDVKEF